MSPRICEAGGKGLVFPLLESEQGWQPLWRAILYATALLYVFQGISVVSDKFMDSIEMITSNKVRIRSRKTGKIVTVRKWNNTVANLTLLALGSSAPEILLSVIEICRNKFHAGVLGPSTIVGSAAFNLFVILAVCIYAVPSSEIRAIKEYNVFIITAVFSVFAYLWLIFVVQVSSPDVVEPWEGCTTLAWFPVLVIVSYWADAGYFNKSSKEEAATTGCLHVEAATLTADSQPPQALTSGPVSEKCAAEDRPRPIFDISGNPLINRAGILSFEQDSTEVLGGDCGQIVKVSVIRCNGAEGTVTCKYRTDNRAGSAIPGRDYTDQHGELTFGPGMQQQDIEVHIMRKQRWECSDSFQIILEESTGGATFNPHDDGGEDTCVLTVKIRNDKVQGEGRLSNMALRVLDGIVNVDRTCAGCAAWKKSIVDSVMDDGVEEGETATFTTKLLHLVTVPWKFPFAVLIPPVEYAGGWICFAMSLVFIGGLTAVILDFAELFGCVTGCDDSITAITFVALGTSMPDLFASKVAACQDETADASIVNVTGSNSVNVFLGIGVPWTMASIYWKVVSPTDEWLTKWKGEFLGQYPEGAFIVKGGDLSFSVVVFLTGAMIALFVLRLRRTHLGGELGGPAGLKALSSLLFVMLWCFYIGLSVWKVKNPVATFGAQLLAIIVAVFVLQNSVLVIGGILKFVGAFDTGATHPDTDEKLVALEEGAAADRAAASLTAKRNSLGVMPEPYMKGLPYHVGGAVQLLPPKQYGLGFDSIDIDFGIDEDEDPLPSLHVAVLVCSFVARLKCRSLRKHQRLGLDQPPLEACLGDFSKYAEQLEHAAALRQGRPKLASAASQFPPLSAGSSVPVVRGTPLPNRGLVRNFFEQRSAVTLTTVGLTCLAVVKFRKGLKRGTHYRRIAPDSKWQARAPAGPPPLPPPAYSPSNSILPEDSGSTEPIIQYIGTSQQNCSRWENCSAQDRPMSFTAVGFTCLAVVKFRKAAQAWKTPRD